MQEDHGTHGDAAVWHVPGSPSQTIFHLGRWPVTTTLVLQTA